MEAASSPLRRGLFIFQAAQAVADCKINCACKTHRYRSPLPCTAKQHEKRWHYRDECTSQEPVQACNT